MSKTQYTVVQHSGWAHGGDPQFRKGLESARVRPGLEEKVLRVGGLLFENYTKAEDYAMRESYPDGYDGLIPKAPGTFTDEIEFEGLDLYLPERLPASEPLRLALIDADNNVVASTDVGTVDDLAAYQRDAFKSQELLGRIRKPVKR